MLTLSSYFAFIAHVDPRPSTIPCVHGIDVDRQTPNGHCQHYCFCLSAVRVGSRRRAAAATTRCGWRVDTSAAARVAMELLLRRVSVHPAAAGSQPPAAIPSHHAAATALLRVAGRMSNSWGPYVKPGLRGRMLSSGTYAKQWGTVC